MKYYTADSRLFDGGTNTNRQEWLWDWAPPVRQWILEGPIEPDHFQLYSNLQLYRECGKKKSKRRSNIVNQSRWIHLRLLSMLVCFKTIDLLDVV